MKMTMKAWLSPVLAVAAMCWGTALAAQDKEAAKAALSARVSLERGLSASASHGRAISAKFEMEDGKLQLSVYTATGGKFFEVVVDPNSGAVIKTEPIVEGEDYTAAQSQSAAMAKAKVSLRATVATAVRGNAGFRAFSVTASLKEGRAVAEVALAKGEEVKTVS